MWFFTVVLMPRVAFPLDETTVPMERSGRGQRSQDHLRNNTSGRGPHAAPQSTLAMGYLEQGEPLPSTLPRSTMCPTHVQGQEAVREVGALPDSLL